MILTTILANLMVTGAALLMLRRGPTKRLKLMTLAVGLMSLAQTVAYMHLQGVFALDPGVVLMVHQWLVIGLCVGSLYLLGREIYDRSSRERTMRLMEHAANIDWKNEPNPLKTPPQPAQTVLTEPEHQQAN
jgi:hypothetical protein